jgi:uncharacterized protein
MPFRVVNKTRGKVLATSAVDATSFYDRFLGLMGRKELPFGEALHLVPCNSIHTFFMRIPIDALFLDAGGKVIKAFPALPAWRVTGLYFKVRSVLELPAGTLAGSGTVEGDELAFEMT